MKILWNQLNLANRVGSKIYISKAYKKVVANLETSIFTWKYQYKLGDINMFPR